jgi:hypothetical protein
MFGLTAALCGWTNSPEPVCDGPVIAFSTILCFRTAESPVISCTSFDTLCGAGALFSWSFFSIFFSGSHLSTAAACWPTALRQPWPGRLLLHYESRSTLLIRHFLSTEKFVSYKTYYDLSYRCLKQYAQISGFRSPRRLNFFYRGTWYLWGLTVELVSCRLSGFCNFEFAPIFLKICTRFDLYPLAPPPPLYMPCCYAGYIRIRRNTF